MKQTSLLLCLSLTLCGCSDDADEPSESGGQGGGPSGQGAAGAPGGGDGKAGPSTACVYVEVSSMYCPDVGPTDNTTREAKCRDSSSCGLAPEEFVSGGCKFSTMYLAQQTFAGTCAEYERQKAGGETPLGGGTCELASSARCAACAKQNCCEPLKACNDPEDCMGYVYCREGCRKYIESPTSAWDICMKDCRGFTRLERSEAVDGVTSCLSQACEDAC